MVFFCVHGILTFDGNWKLHEEKIDDDRAGSKRQQLYYRDYLPQRFLLELLLAKIFI